MPKAQKGEHGSVVIRYGLLLFTVIVLFAGIMSFILLRFAAERFERYEVQTVQSGMQLAADDLENQCESLNEIASKIRVTSYYQPSIVCLDAYREIELLEDFVYFRNFSPVIDKYFLLYPEEGDGRQKIYISDGRVAYFSYYAKAAFGIREEETALLLRHLLDLRTQECLMIGDTVLLITPVRFVETQGPDSRALVVFLLPIKRLNARMHQMAASLPAQVQVATQTMPLASFTANGVETLPFLGDAIPEGQRLIEVTSSDGKLKLSCPFADDKWSLLHSSLPKWVFAGIGLCLVVVAAVSAMLARRMAKPLLDFIHRHMPPGERFRNEFVQLEELVGRMEQENGSSMKRLRSRTLLTILRGYYNESLLKRWGFMNLQLNRKAYCVLVVGASGLEEKEAEGRAERIERMSDALVTFYAAAVPEDQVIAAIAGFDQPWGEEEAARRMQELAGRWGAVCNGGRSCDTPQRISISYMEAMTAHLRAVKWKSENLCDMHTFAVQMVTAAQRGDEDGMRQLCAELVQQTENAGASRLVTSTMAAQLMTELGVLAGGQHLALDREKVSRLTLLPTLPLLLKDTCELVRETFPVLREERMNRVDETAQAIVEYVKENAFDADFDLQSIADRFGLSNDYASTMVKKVTGTAFKEYLTELRLEKARRLLEESDLAVNEISLRVGYRKASNFIRKFKETYGYTPAQYRKGGDEG